MINSCRRTSKIPPVWLTVTTAVPHEALETIARDGPRAFYEGDIARDIAEAVQHDPRKPGSLTVEDLARYRAIERTAHARGTYCGYGKLGNKATTG